MRKAIAVVGFIMLVQGVSGAIDRLAVQPFFGPILNLFNRRVIPRLDVFTGYELFANLLLAALGALIMFAAARHS
jgi:hypothetical protein